MEKYTTWDAVPSHLKTKTQLGKAGLRLAKGQRPVARKTGGKGPFDLYDEREAVAKRKPSAGQLVALKKAREAADKVNHCAHCHAPFARRARYRYRNGRYRYRYNHEDGYICADCFARHEERVDARRLLESGFVVLDTETTGLEDDAQIVSIAIIDSDGNTLLDTLVRPTIRIPDDAVAIHGITNEMVAGAPTMAQLYDQVRKLLSNRTVVIYNAAFDVRLLGQSVRATHKIPVTPPDEWGMQTYCAMESAKTYLGRERWLSLVSTAEYFGLDTSGAHGALADCRMTLGVIRGMAGVDPPPQK